MLMPLLLDLIRSMAASLLTVMSFMMCAKKDKGVMVEVLEEAVESRGKAV